METLSQVTNLLYTLLKPRVGYTLLIGGGGANPNFAAGTCLLHLITADSPYRHYDKLNHNYQNLREYDKVHKLINYELYTVVYQIDLFHENYYTNHEFIDLHTEAMNLYYYIKSRQLHRKLANRGVQYRDTTAVNFTNELDLHRRTLNRASFDFTLDCILTTTAYDINVKCIDTIHDTPLGY